MNKGYTLIEMLVVIAVFAIVSLITSETIILTLRGTKKADAISQVRDNLDFAMGSMERQLHNAKSVSPCPNINTQQITFTDQNNNQVTFSCIGVNNNNLPANIASGSASLTSSNITLTSCRFSCNPATTSKPASVTIAITAKDLNGQNAPVSSTTQVTLRTY